MPICPRLRQLCEPDDAGERTLEMAMRRLGLSAHAYDRILEVSRTVADLGASDTISAKHIAEGTPVPQPGPQLLELA